MSDEHSDRPGDARRAFLKRMAAVGFAAPLITTFEPVAAAAAGEKPGHHQHQHTTEHCKTTTPAPTSTATTTPAPTSTATTTPAPTSTATTTSSTTAAPATTLSPPV